MSLLASCLMAVFLLAHAPAAQATPSFQAAGTPVNGTGAVTPTWPTHAVDDIALLIVESRGDEPVTLSTAAGFVEVTNSPQITGTDTRLTVFWARATSTAMASPTVADPGNHVFAQIVTYRNVTPDAGDPWDVTGGGTKTTASTSVTVTGVTTTVDNTLIVQIVSRANDANGAAFSAQANANLTTLTERYDDGTNNGDGGGFVVWDGVKATAGATGNTTATVTSTTNAFLTIALKPIIGPAPPPGRQLRPDPVRRRSLRHEPGLHRERRADHQPCGRGQSRLLHGRRLHLHDLRCHRQCRYPGSLGRRHFLLQRRQGPATDLGKRRRFQLFRDRPADQCAVP